MSLPLLRPGPGLACLTLLLVLPCPLWASEPALDEGAPLRVNLAVDLSLTLGLLSMNGLSLFVWSELSGPDCGPLCDPEGLNALDRTVVGWRSTTAALTADVLVATSLVLPHVLGLVDQLAADPRDWESYWVDTVILAEALTLAISANQLIKFAVRRPRPYAYDPAVEESRRTGADASFSFYSGHTSNAFAMATSYSTLFTLRHPRSAGVIPLWLGTHLLASSGAVMQVMAGKHFWTDVMAGAAIGSAIGLATVFLHRQPQGLTVTPLPMEGGLGLALTLR